MPTKIIESATINGVFLSHLEAFGDERGQFMETFRKEWFPQRSWRIVQSNRSESVAGVLRGLHYHFKQVDYWCVMSGTLRAVLLDIRPDSATFGCHQTIDMGADNRIGLFIPVGVAHGFAALSDCVLAYIVDNYYDNSDEYGVAWNDPALSIDWGLAEPLVSGRDSTNPCLTAIPREELPTMAHSRAQAPAG